MSIYTYLNHLNSDWNYILIDDSWSCSVVEANVVVGVFTVVTVYDTAIVE